MPSQADKTRRRRLRSELRALRRGLCPTARRRAERVALSRLRRLPCFRRARRIAIYQARDAELDPCALSACSAKQFFLPVLHARGLRFAPATRPRSRRNRFAIPEPLARYRLRPAELDLVIVPLIGFDAHGNRLGAGGGYYDRSFALHRPPALVGLAFACQQVAALEAAAWDVPMDLVVTEGGVVAPRDWRATAPAR